ncbi:MAG: LptF/LptG family permease [Deinococcota bacterium]
MYTDAVFSQPSSGASSGASSSTLSDNLPNPPSRRKVKTHSQQLLGKLARYLLGEVTVLYLLGVGAFCLLLSIDFLTVWAEFLITQNASLASVGRLMLFQVPWFLHMSLPVAGVFAVLLATGRWARDSELKAAYAAGVAPLRLLRPLLWFGLAVSLLALYNNGFLEPIGQRAYDALRDSFYSQRPPSETQRDVSFAIDEQGIYYAGRIRGQREERHLADLSGIFIFQNDGDTVSAPEGIWDSNKGVWRLQNAQVMTEMGLIRRYSSLELPFQTQSDAAQNLADADTLTLRELNARIREDEARGINARDARFEFHRRIADAFSALVFILVAGVLGLQLRARSAGFRWTIVLLVLFYFLWTLSADLFDRRVLTAVAAAWFTSAVVGGVAGTVALWRLR